MTGSRDRSELKGLLLGSVGLGAAARAHCPAIVRSLRPSARAGRPHPASRGVPGGDRASE
ncbi:hypothetical protein ACFWD7_35805 [Streptomyces mirabilis]|uniref:hypothetical protein n=1 Tax=Streptomyces mirabilis TaxID=68239 RepID=UPI0036A87101